MAKIYFVVWLARYAHSYPVSTQDLVRFHINLDNNCDVAGSTIDTDDNDVLVIGGWTDSGILTENPHYSTCTAANCCMPYPIAMLLYSVTYASIISDKPLL